MGDIGNGDISDIYCYLYQLSNAAKKQCQDLVV